MRTHLAAAFSAVTLTTGMLLTAPTASAQPAAYPTTPFNVAVTNTYTTGTLTWYGRSVLVEGVHKSADQENCRGTTAFTLDAGNGQLGVGYSNTRSCAGEVVPFSFTVPADVPGGAAVVRVCLDDGSAPPPTYFKCVRYGHP
ncbi:hypothetical protein ACWECR_39445 [Streptomyces sp. NPDC005056]